MAVRSHLSDVECRDDSVVAGNRYIAVCRPMMASRLCTMNRVQLEILIIANVMVILDIPRFFDVRYMAHNVAIIDENNIT